MNNNNTWLTRELIKQDAWKYWYKEPVRQPIDPGPSRKHYALARIRRYYIDLGYPIPSPFTL